MMRMRNHAGPVKTAPAYDNRIVTLLRGSLTPRLLQEQLEDFHERDMAEALALLRPDERQRLYSVLAADTLAAVMDYAEDTYLEELPAAKRLDVLGRWEPSKTAAYLQEREPGERQVLLDLLDGETRQQVLEAASFGGEEIGREMEKNYVTVAAGSTVKQAMKALVEQAAENDNIGTVYVTQADGTFGGAIDLKDLIVARETTPLEQIVKTSYPYVYAREQTEDCLERLADYGEDSIPVLDGDNRLQGVLTAQTLTRLVGETVGDDYAKLGGLASQEDLQEPVGRSVRKRLPWLVVLLFLGMGVSAVTGLFEGVIAQLTIIMCFQSLILDMSGNVGTQSLAVTVRVLADGRLTGREKWQLVKKEAKVGLAGGLLLGCLAVAAVGLYVLVLKGQPVRLAVGVALCTGLALVLSMLVSGITGTAVPLLFKRLGVDPAVASGPLITTLNDLTAVVTYYGLSWLLLIHWPIW